MALSYKICAAEDIEALINISKNTFIDAFEQDNDPADFAEYLNVAFSFKTLMDQLKNPNSEFYFVYDSENVLTGYFKINQFNAQTEFQDSDGLELERIYVLKEYQNKGYGKLILEEVIRVAKIKAKSYVWLGVWEKNQNAIRFYERFGFLRVGTHPYYIGKDKQTDWILKRELT